MPDWWLELAKISDMDDHQELARKVRASFKLPQQISEQHGMENYHQAPPALLCICQKDFLPQHDSNFSCQDIKESQLEKTVACAQALQFWAEKANLPTPGQACLLAGSVLELMEAMKCYISFPDDAVFDSVALPGESLTNQSTAPESTQPASTNSPIEEAAVKAAKEEPAPTGRPPEGPSTSQTPSKGPTRRELTKLIPWVEGSVTSLQAGHCCWAGPSDLSKFQMETLYQEFWGKDGSVLKGRGTATDSKCKVRAHIANGDAGNCMASDTTSKLPGSNGLLAEGPIASGCL